ncbi:MAG: hypothetical protein Q7T82_01040 [Armatimonadota bacterium]|nr:hypothetical protein [Armatimonadota bacterium]
MDISEINMRLSSLAWTSSNGAGPGGDVRIFPSAKNDFEVIGAYDRLAADAQRFEVVCQDGQVYVRPWLPETTNAAVASRMPLEEEEAVIRLKAA